MTTDATDTTDAGGSQLVRGVRPVSEARPLVERLRQRAGQYDEYDWHEAIELEAVAELERLSQELSAANGQVLRAAADLGRLRDAFLDERERCEKLRAFAQTVAERAFEHHQDYWAAQAREALRA